MLDSSIQQQLQTVFGRLETSVTLSYFASAHAQQGELVTLLEDVAGTSDNVHTEAREETSEVPRFIVRVDNRDTGIAFTGIPSGHEFTSLVLAVLYADGKGKQPDDAIIARVRRLRGPIRLRTYVSLSCTNCPDVVQTLNLFASLHDDFTHEMIDGAFVPEQIASLGIQGVPAVIVDTKLLSSGKATLAELLERLEAHFGVEAADAAPAELGDFDVTVVGGGPAGVAAAIYAARKGLKTAIISERMGGQLQETKGIENLISVPYIEGPILSARLGEHLAAYDIKLLDHRRLTDVVANQGDASTPSPQYGLTLNTDEQLNTRALIVATGAKWRKLGVEGEETYLGHGVAFCPHCDGPYYKGKEIAVIGGGNSGVEAAIDLAGIVKSVTVVEFLPELKADEVLVKKLESLPNVKVIRHARTQAILGDGEKVTALAYEDRGTGEVHEVPLAGVFVQIGLVPNSAVVSDLVETTRYGEIVVDTKCRTNTPGIYAAGDVTTVPYKQIVIAMGEGAKAGLAAFEDLMITGG